MKQIPTSELREGDVFAKETKLKGRMSYLVHKVKNESMRVTKRNGDVTQAPQSITFKTLPFVYWLRNLND